MSTFISNNALLVGFLFDFMSSFFPSLFCVCEDANVTHKVSIVKKKKTIVGFVHNIALISVAKPTCLGQQVGFLSTFKDYLQMETYCCCGDGKSFKINSMSLKPAESIPP